MRKDISTFFAFSAAILMLEMAMKYLTQVIGVLITLIQDASRKILYNMYCNFRVGKLRQNCHSLVIKHCQHAKG
jgi:hypothetical protein